MTSRSCSVNTRASLLLVLVVADVVLFVRTTGLRVTHRRTSTPQQTSQQTGDHVAEPTVDRDGAAALDASVLQTLGLQHVVGARRHHTPAAERVVVPEYMWQLYRRQRRANRERQHRRSAASGDYVPPPYYTANTIRSFVATSNSDTLLTGKCSCYSIEQLYLCSKLLDRPTYKLENLRFC